MQQRIFNQDDPSCVKLECTEWTQKSNQRKLLITEVHGILSSCLTFPAQIYILRSTMTVSANEEMILFYIRMASWNQILDPWIYITFKVPRLRRVKSNATVRKHQHSSPSHCSLPLGCRGPASSACQNHLLLNLMYKRVCSQFAQYRTVIHKITI